MLSELEPYMGTTLSSPNCAKKLVNGFVTPGSSCQLACTAADNPKKLYKSKTSAYCECDDDLTTKSRVCSWGIRIKGKKMPLDSTASNGVYVMPILFGTTKKKCQGIIY